MRSPAKKDNKRYIAFGLSWESELLLEQFNPCQTTEASPDITISYRQGSLPQRIEVLRWGRTVIYSDGFRFFADNFAIWDFYAPDKLEIASCRPKRDRCALALGVSEAKPLALAKRYAITEDSLEIYPGTGWEGEVTTHFYGTVAAAVLAYHGGIPIHGSAVEFGGCAILICGKSGLGKSSVSAELIQRGGRLVSDDLSILWFRHDGQAIMRTGRTNLRLAPPSASMLMSTTIGARQVGYNAVGKAIIMPPIVPPDREIPLKNIIILDEGMMGEEAIPDQRHRPALLLSQIFRPRLMKHLPRLAERAQHVMTIGSRTPFMCLRSIPPLDRRGINSLVERVIDFNQDVLK